ncbi:hypothetical protein [Nocardioides terrisoli]|nr:hypothetical protein [Nocardioides marmorisolisilvae]
MSIFGCCNSAPGAVPDQYHAVCIGRFVDQFGVEHVCGCVNHEYDEEEE